MAAYFSVLEPGDRILGMNLAHGGHLTHGMALNFSGPLYEVHAYGVRQDTERIDYDAMETQAREVRPKLIVGGASRLSAAVGLRADGRDRRTTVGALLFVDMAHVAGLVAAGVHPSPFPHADLVTTTTHKTLRGPRGGLIFVRRDAPTASTRPTSRRSRMGCGGALAATIDRNVFPGVAGRSADARHRRQGGRVQAGRRGDVPRDQRRTVENAQVMAETLAGLGARVVSGGTDNHLMLVDVTPLGVTGKEAEHLLDEIGITVNKNAHPVRQAAAEHRVRGSASARRPRRRAASAPTRCAPSAGSSSRRSSAGRAGRPGRLAGEVREIVGRFPVPGLPARDSPTTSGDHPGTVHDLDRDCGSAIVPIVVAFLCAALLALVLTPMVRRVVLRYEIVDRPEARRVNTVPVPRGGGLAVSAAFLARRRRVPGRSTTRSMVVPGRDVHPALGGRGAPARRRAGGRARRHRRPVRPPGALAAPRSDRAGDAAPSRLGIAITSSPTRSAAS